MAQLEVGVLTGSDFVVQKLLRLSWLITRADEPHELRALECALVAVLAPERTLH